jgi:hypothetical protein
LFPDPNDFGEARGLTPEEQYKQYRAGVDIWRKGAADLPKGQLDLQRGIPPDIFGLRAPEGNPVPAGSKLAFKTKTLDGNYQWHYETPDGKIVTADREIPLLPEPKPVPPKPVPYEAGTSHAGSPYTSQSASKAPVTLMTPQEWDKAFGKLNPPPKKTSK